MKFSLKYKYKLRKPKQTIAILKDFFKQEGFEYRIVENNCSEVGSWSCRVELYKNNFYFLGANGKGMTESYSLASGFSELYERYCNDCPIGGNIPYNFFNKERRRKKQGYVYHPDEIKIDVDTLLKYPLFNEYYAAYEFDNDFLKNLLIKINGNDFIGAPYKSIDSDEILYLDPKIITDINGSQGMAAGNSFEEALVQGNSELWEKYVGHFFFQHEFEEYHAIDLKTIKNTQINNSINKIKELGYKFWVLDLSYNFNVPVLMSILLKKSGEIFLNFGSFPVFEIALERIITELYQGIYTYKTSLEQIVPYRTSYKDEIISKYSASCATNFFPEHLFNKFIFGSYNENIFINKHTSIENLCEYCKKINKLNNYQIYYLDRSRLNNFAAIHLFCPQLDLSIYIKKWFKSHFEMVQQENVLKIIDLYLNIFSDALNNKFTYEYYQELYTLFTNNTKDFEGVNIILFCDFFSLTNYKPFLGTLSIFANDQIDNYIKLSVFNSQYNYEIYRKYSILNSYVSTKEYSNEELFFIFNELFDFNITEEDIAKATEGKYLIKKIYHEPIINFINMLIS